MVCGKGISDRASQSCRIDLRQRKGRQAQNNSGKKKQRSDHAMELPES